MKGRCWFSISTNDALGMNMKNIGVLLNAKHVYFVPFKQDNPQKKPNSMIASLILDSGSRGGDRGKTVSTDYSIEKGKTMGTFTGFCSQNIGFAMGRCVEDTDTHVD